MKDTWQPGDRAVVDDPASCYHRLVVWLVKPTEIGDAVRWSISERLGGPVVGFLWEDQFHRADRASASKWFERAVQAFCVATTIATFAWLLLGKGGVK